VIGACSHAGPGFLCANDRWRDTVCFPLLPCVCAGRQRIARRVRGNAKHPTWTRRCSQPGQGSAGGSPSSTGWAAAADTVQRAHPEPAAPFAQVSTDSKRAATAGGNSVSLAAGETRLRDTFRMARYGYARISTRCQRDDSQLDALRDAGCERIWTDTASGHAAPRAALACPTCGREPATRGEARQQREDLAIVWLHLHVTISPRPGTAWHASRTSTSSTSAAPAAATVP
jgi:hypothetical protein